MKLWLVGRVGPDTGRVGGLHATTPFDCMVSVDENGFRFVSLPLIDRFQHKVETGTQN
jgi:hypothetical protein